MIYVDIDGVIADFTQALLDFVSMQTHRNLDYFQITRWDFFDDLSFYIDRDVYPILQQFSHSDEVHNIKPIKDSNILNDISAAYDVTLLTARPDYCIEHTVNWLNKHGFKYDNIIHDKDKANLIKCDHSAEYLIEDNLDNAIKCSEYCDVLLLDKLYNQHIDVPTVRRVDDWKEIKDILL